MKPWCPAIYVVAAIFMISRTSTAESHSCQDKEKAMARPLEVMTREQAAAILGERIIYNNDGEATTVCLRGQDASPEMLRAIEVFPELYGFGVVDANVEAAAIVPVLRQLPNLTYAHFVRCPRVTDGVLPEVAALPKLESLNLDATGITDEGLLSLLVSRSLISVSLSQTAITDAGVKTMANLPTLVGLHVCDTPVTDEGLKALRGHERLKVVWASGSKIGDEGLAHLATCPLLTEVLARKTHLTDAGIEAIAKARHLRLLHASGKFSRRSIAALAACSELRSFLLEGDIEVGDQDVAIFSSFKGFRSIGLWGSRISEAGEVQLKAILPKTSITMASSEP
ncbi:MAG: hypothetical protein WD060_05430 [Pirellulales bacterium]